MLTFLRFTALVVALGFACASSTTAATPKEIENAIKKGCDWFKARYGKNAAAPLNSSTPVDYGIGPMCLAGLAMIEGGTSVDDPALKNIASQVRNASYSQTRTYQASLCLMFLDRLGEQADEHLIQMLAVRLMSGQTGNGGWTYDTGPAVPAQDLQRLQAMKPNPQPGKLHPDIKDYAQSLFAAKARDANNASYADDNSNTQFAVIAVWMARKHGVPVESALELIERRFLGTQSARTGGWAYSGGPMGDISSASPSMHCAGLIGLSMAMARREERKLKSDPPKKEPKANPKSRQVLEDPFFNPPKPGAAEPKKNKSAPVSHQPDNRDRAVQLAFAGLGSILAESAKAGRGALVLANRGHGHHDLYFFWSLERVGMIYGIEKIGGVDWYDAGAQTLVHTQAPDGSWMGSSGYGSEVDTAFAVLFLTRSNLVSDLSGKVQKEVSTEMRAGAGPTGTSKKPNDPTASLPGNGATSEPSLTGIGGEAATLAAELLRASEKDWTTALKKLRDTKGTAYTQALVASVSRLDGERRREARQALAERLTRMTGETLRAMAKDDDAELRRASVLAMAMKDDKGHIRDLINALLDEEEVVTRAAKAGLKSLTGQDFGPAVNATAGEKKLAVTAWNDWLARQKK